MHTRKKRGIPFLGITRLVTVPPTQSTQRARTQPSNIMGDFFAGGGGFYKVLTASHFSNYGLSECSISQAKGLNCTSKKVLILVDCRDLRKDTFTSKSERPEERRNSNYG